MTVATTINRKVYAGNGITVAFPTTFEFEAAEDLTVILKVNTTGIETTKAITTDFTVTGGNGNTGTVTMIVPPPNGTTFTVFNDPAIVQDLDLVEGDVSPAEAKELAYDRLTFICQRLADRMDRAIRLSEGFSTSFDLTLPELLTADTTLVINSTGDGFDLGPDISTIVDAEANALAAAASAASAAGSASGAASSAAAAAISAALTAVDVIQFVERGTTPATPAAGNRKVYSKSDGVYQLNSAGIEQKVGAGGGGGGGVLWRLLSNAPAEMDYAGFETLDFNSQDVQEIWAQLPVPADYVAGTQIFIKSGSFSCPSVAGKVKFLATAYLIEDGVTALGTYPNTRNSTNAAVTVSGTTNRQTAVGDIDLTTASGQINGVSVAANDMILVKLVRDTAGEVSAGGSAAGDASLPRYKMIPKFS